MCNQTCRCYTSFTNSIPSCCLSFHVDFAHIKGHWLANMSDDIHLGDDVQVTLCILYSLGAVASLWLILISPFLLEWLGVKMGRRVTGKKDWPKIFLFSILIQPVTFLASAIGLWWVGAMAVLPPINLVISFLTFVAIDFFRDEKPEKMDIELSKLMEREPYIS